MCQPTMDRFAQLACVACLGPMLGALLGSALGCSSTQGDKAPRFSQVSTGPEGKVDDSPLLDSKQTSDMRLAMARMAEQQGQFTNALTTYRQVLQDAPDHPVATHRIAVIYDRQGDFEASALWFQKALKLAPGNADIFCDIGFSQLNQGRDEEALRNLKQAIAFSPDHARAHNHIGIAYGRRGQADEAIAHFRRAGCTAAEAHINLSVALEAGGQPDRARENLHYAMQLTPTDQRLQDRLAGLDDRVAGQRATLAATQKADAEIARLEQQRQSLRLPK